MEDNLSPNMDTFENVEKGGAMNNSAPKVKKKVCRNCKKRETYAVDGICVSCSHFREK